MPPPTSNPPPQPYWLLRRADQVTVALLTLVGIGLTVAWWVSHAGRGRLVEVERAAPQTAQFQVDVNQADWPELAELPGIGPTLARRIVQVRTADGPFVDHDDIRRRVRGIGPVTLEKMRPYLQPIPGGEEVAAK